MIGMQPAMTSKYNLSYPYLSNNKIMIYRGEINVVSSRTPSGIKQITITQEEKRLRSIR